MKPLFPAAVGLLVTLGVSAQQDDPAQFRSESNLVVLQVNVYDRGDDAVMLLTRDNFEVAEDGQPQRITFFNSQDIPVTVGLIIDNSSSMITRRNMVVAGGMAFADSSHPDDELFTISFTENVRLGLPERLKFTRSHTLLQATLNRMKPGGQTALYDAVIRGLDHVRDGGHQKRVLIVLSDGDDTASQHTKKDMLERATNSDVIIYAIGVRGASEGEAADPGVLRDLARIGGGVAFFPRTEAQVIEDFGRIARNIRRGYGIGYVPTNSARDGSFRRVDVKVRVAGRTLEARFRHGYTAATHSSGAH